jgi:hypothetical protein
MQRYNGMRNAMRGIGKEIAEFFTLVFVLVIGALTLNELRKLVPDNAATQSLKGTYEFLVHLFIDWGSPDLMPRIILIVVAIAAVFGIYKKSQQIEW